MRPIKIYNPDDVMYPVIKECLARKDLMATECGIILDSPGIMIRDKNLEIRGMSTCIQYLDDKYPHPPFFPLEPEKRAIIRMMVDELMSQPNKIEVYAEQIPEYDFFSGFAPSILDIFLYALAPNDDHWRAFKRRVSATR